MGKLLAAVTAVARRGCQRLCGTTSNRCQQIEDSRLPATGPKTGPVNADAHAAQADLYVPQLAGEWPTRIKP
jgi:hypothetical protein